MVKAMRTPTRVCETFTPRNLTPARQREISEVAYQLWLARGFRNGSPQEDWLRAQREVCRQRLRA